MQIHVLCYNTHLMQFSFIEWASDLKRSGGVVPYMVFQDEPRRDLMIRNIKEISAHIVCLQEVWALSTLEHFINQLDSLYPHRTGGDYDESVPGTATSGLFIFSKYPLSDRTFKKFPGMEGEDEHSNKGVLGVTVNIPDGGKLRVFTAHTSGQLRDIVTIANESRPRTPLQKDQSTIMLGDFNVSWKATGSNEEYKYMKKVFSFAGTGLKAASDSWIDRHGEALDPDPFTVKMRENTLQQLFSPSRDTEPDTRLDYLWLRDGTVDRWEPVAARVLRGNKWTYTSRDWHWAHPNRSDQMPSAAAKDDRLVVVSRETWGRVTCSIFNQTTGEWRHVYAGFDSSASPGIVVFQNEFHVFYRDNSSGKANAIFHRASTDGEHWGNAENIGIDTGGSVCAIEWDRQLYLFYVDPDGIGGMIFCTVKNIGGDYGPGNWGARTATGITTRWNMSVTGFNGGLALVSKDNGDMGKSSGVMCAFLQRGRPWEWTHPDGLQTSGSPGVIALGDKLHVYYRHHAGNAIYRAIYDGRNWTINENTLHDRARNAVCPVFYANKLWLFYSYLCDGKGGCYYQDNSMIQTQMPDTEVDLSDHYPLLVTLEPRNILVNVLVKIRSMGEVIFRENVWAGTRGENDPIDGFKLTGAYGLKFRYMAHIQDVGDTGWKSDGEYLGVSGQKRIEGFAIKLEGPDASKYDLSYKAHIQNVGDTVFVGNGEFCGTRHQGKAVEAMFIQLTKK